MMPYNHRWRIRHLNCLLVSRLLQVLDQRPNRASSILHGSSFYWPEQDLNLHSLHWMAIIRILFGRNRYRSDSNFRQCTADCYNSIFWWQFHHFQFVINFYVTNFLKIGAFEKWAHDRSMFESISRITETKMTFSKPHFTFFFTRIIPNTITTFWSRANWLFMRIPTTTDSTTRIILLNYKKISPYSSKNRYLTLKSERAFHKNGISILFFDKTIWWGTASTLT